MAQITKEITVDVARRNLFQAIVAKQHDSNSRFLKVTLTNEGTIISVDTNSVVTINASRSDGLTSAFAGMVNADGTVTVPLTTWMLELDDLVKCDITVVDSKSRKLTSTSFELEVEPAAHRGSDINEDENYDLLVSLLGNVADVTGECQKATQAATIATENAADAASKALAATENAADATSKALAAAERVEAAEHNAKIAAEQAEAAEHNAKIAAEQAEAAKQNAEESAGTASDAADVAAQSVNMAKAEKTAAENARIGAEAAAQNADRSALDAREQADDAKTARDASGAAAVAAQTAADEAADSADAARAAASSAETAALNADRYAQTAVASVGNAVNGHNSSSLAHSDIRSMIGSLAASINAVLDSDDTTLDQLSEIVAYIKSNKSLIDAITTSKVSVADIVDNLVTNVSNKPLSAAMGVELKNLVDELDRVVNRTEELPIIELAGYVIDGSGVVAEGKPEQLVSEPIAVKAGQQLLVTGSSWDRYLIWAIYDGSGRVLSYEMSADVGSEVVDQPVTVPEGAVSMRVAWNTVFTHNSWSVVRVIGQEPAGAVAEHNASETAHGDIRLTLQELKDQIYAALNSDDTTLDQLSEIVSYITSNKSLIDAITTSKVSVADIVDNLVTNVSNKPLSAAQGVVLKGLIDTLSASLSGYQPKGDYALASDIPTKTSQLQNDSGYLTEHQDISHLLPREELPDAVDDALAQAKESGEFDGAPGNPGKDGDTPVKGVDYFTPDEVQEIVETAAEQAEAVIYKQAELINHFVVEEDVQGLYIDRDSDGNPLNLTFAVLRLTCGNDVAAGNSGAGCVFFYFDSDFARAYTTGFNYHGYEVSEGNYRPTGIFARCDMRDGVVMLRGFAGETGYATVELLQFPGEDTKIVPNASITKVRLDFVVPRNAKVWIYGIRRSE